MTHQSKSRTLRFVLFLSKDQKNEEIIDGKICGCLCDLSCWMADLLHRYLWLGDKRL